MDIAFKIPYKQAVKLMDEGLELVHKTYLMGAPNHFAFYCELCENKYEDRHILVYQVGAFNYYISNYHEELC